MPTIKFKLKDPKFCNGCLCRYEIVNYDDIFNFCSIFGMLDRKKRPKSCIEKYGEWIMFRILKVEFIATTNNHDYCREFIYMIVPKNPPKNYTAKKYVIERIRKRYNFCEGWDICIHNSFTIFPKFFNFIGKYFKL